MQIPMKSVLKKMVPAGLLEAMDHTKFYSPRMPWCYNLCVLEGACNFRCTTCPLGDETLVTHWQDRKIMPPEVFRTIIDQVPNHWQSSIDISPIGETLTYPHLTELIEYASQTKPKASTVLSTNGHFLTEDYAEKLIRAGLKNLQFSLYAPNEELWKTITQVRTPDGYSTVRRNLDGLIAARARLGSSTPKILVFLYDLDEIKEQAADFVAEYEPKVDTLYMRTINTRTELQGERVEKAVPCMQFWYELAFRHNGDVVPCCNMYWSHDADDLAVGNVMDETIEEIYSGSKLRHYRELHARGKWDDIGPCRECCIPNTTPNLFRYSRLRKRFVLPFSGRVLKVISRAHENLMRW